MGRAPARARRALPASAARSRRSRSKRGRIAAARVRDRRGRRHRVEADWFVCAMPVERARRVLGPRACARSTRRSNEIDELFVDWMDGIQFYLRRKVDITHGHLTFVDAPWALTALTQGQFWAERDFARDYGDGSAVDCLSVDISDWDTPGILYGKPAKQCTREEIAKRGLGADQGAPHGAATSCPTTSCTRGSSTPAIAWSREARREPQRRRRCWSTRSARGRSARRRSTKIPNLFLAGDYVQTDIDLATMEGANESGRAAVDRAAATRRARRPSRRRCTSSTTRPSSRPLKAGRRRALQGRPAERARRRVSAAERVDAVVVGARCAGSAAATALARAGRRVVVARPRAASRPTRSRPTCCGPAASPSCRRSARSSASQALGAPPLPRALAGARRARRSRAATRRSTGSTTRCACAGPGSTPRSSTTAREAGAEVREGARVTDLRLGRRPRRGRALRRRRRRERELRAPLVVGADGRRSTVARLVGAERAAPRQAERPRLLLRVLGGRPARVARRPPRSGARAPSSARRSPATTGCCSCCCSRRSIARDEFRADLAGDVRAHGRRDPRARRAARRLPPGDARSAPPPTSSPTSAARPAAGWALAGDAGHFKDPVTAQGIRDALRYGRLLGEAAAPVLDDPAAPRRGARALGARRATATASRSTSGPTCWRAASR